MVSKISRGIKWGMALLACLLLLSCQREEMTNGIEPDTDRSMETVENQAGSPTMLTHVFRERTLSLPDGFVASDKVKPTYRDGILRMYCTRDNREGEEYVMEHYLYECPLDGGAGTATSLTLDKLYANWGTIAGEKVYLVDSSMHKDTYERLYNMHIYNLADGQLTTIEDVFSRFPAVAGVQITLRDVAVDGDGYVYLACDDAVCVLKPDGTAEAALTELGFVDGLAVDGEGIVVSILGGNAVQTIGRGDRTVTESAALPEALLGADVALGEGYPLYGITEEGLFGVHGSDTVLLADWQNSNVNADHMDAWLILSPETMLAYMDDGWVILEKGEDVDLSDITVVDLAYVAADGLGFQEEGKLREEIVAFNKANPTVRVMAADYSIYNNEENLHGGRDRLLQDMTSGLYTPDLIFGAAGGAVVSSVIDGGLYTDLYTYMTGNVQPEDLVGAVGHTYERNDQLTAIPAQFQMKTLLAPKELVGERTSWTLEEMLDTALSLPEGTHLMDRATAEDWLHSGMAYASFVDLGNYTCHFGTPTFQKLLQFAAQLPEAAERTKNVYEPWQTGQMMLYPCVYKGIMDYQKDPVVYNDKAYVRIGYPDVGHMLTDTAMGGNGTPAVYLIPKGAADAAAAWQFVESVLTNQPEMDMITTGNIRTVRALNDTAKTIFSPYTSFYMYNGQFSRWMGDRNQPDENGRINGQPGVLVPWSEAEFDEFTKWLDTAGTPMPAGLPTEVLAIVQEEVSAYIAGGRTAEETAAILQSRVSLWLAEKRG